MEPGVVASLILFVIVLVAGSWWAGESLGAWNDRRRVDRDRNEALRSRTIGLDGATRPPGPGK